MSTNINFDKKLGITGGTGISLPSSAPAFEDIYSYEFDGVDDKIQSTSIFNNLDGQDFIDKYGFPVDFSGSGEVI